MTDAELAGIATRDARFVLVCHPRPTTARSWHLRCVITTNCAPLPTLASLSWRLRFEPSSLPQGDERSGRKRLDTSELVDRASERLRAVAEKTLKKGSDVHKVAKDEVEPESDDGESVDIMALCDRVWVRASRPNGRALRPRLTRYATHDGVSRCRHVADLVPAA